MGGAVFSRILITGSGLLYPAYSSYKAVKAASLRGYVRWIMYWVVFALYMTIEIFTDIFFAWLPFYYEIKVLFVLWLSMPYTKGSSFLYRKLIHPSLSRREQDIDLFLENAKERGYQAVVHAGSKGLNLAATAVVTAAVKGQAVVTDKLRSYSVMDLANLPDNTPMHAQTSLNNPQLVRERLHKQSSEPSHDSGLLSNQFQAYSMYNLANDPVFPEGDSRSTEQANELNYFDNQVPTHTTDDMRIPRKVNYAEESIAEPDDYASYSRTMPKNIKTINHSNYKQPIKEASKSKSKMPPMPSSSNTKELRRSKRHRKNNSLENIEDF